MQPTRSGWKYQRHSADSLFWLVSSRCGQSTAGWATPLHRFAVSWRRFSFCPWFGFGRGSVLSWWMLSSSCWWSSGSVPALPVTAVGTPPMSSCKPCSGRWRRGTHGAYWLTGASPGPTRPNRRATNTLPAQGSSWAGNSVYTQKIWCFLSIKWSKNDYANKFLLLQAFFSTIHLCDCYHCYIYR